MKQPLSTAELTDLAHRGGLTPAAIVNRRSSGFRAMKTEVRDDAHALQLLLANPKIMIRPALATGEQAVFGFDEISFQQLVK